LVIRLLFSSNEISVHPSRLPKNEAIGLFLQMLRCVCISCWWERQLVSGWNKQTFGFKFLVTWWQECNYIEKKPPANKCHFNIYDL